MMYDEQSEKKIQFLFFCNFLFFFVKTKQQALQDYNTALDLVKQNKLGQEKASILYMNKGQLYDRVSVFLCNFFFSFPKFFFSSSKMKLPQKAVVEYTEYINTKGYLTPVATNNLIVRIFIIIVIFHLNRN